MASPPNTSGKERLSASRIGSFMSCRRAYYWTYIENLTPIQKADYFQTGIVVHALREKWVKGELQITDIKDLKKTVQNDFPTNDPEVTEKVALEAATLFNGYVQQFQDSDFKLVSPEMTLEADMGEFILYSRFDGLAIDEDENYYRDELKTSAKMDSGYLNGLRRGLQTGISYIVADKTLDFKLKGTLFEIIVKTKIPQYQRMPVIRDGFITRYAMETIQGVWNDIKWCGKKKERFYPSMNCSYGNNLCPFETLCREDTPLKRKAFFTAYHPT